MKRIAESDDELDRRVGVDGEVQVAAWELIDFINHKNASALEKRGLPSSEAPGVGGRELHEFFPLGAELGGRNGELEVSERRGVKQLDDGMGFAAAREAGNVDEADRAGLGDVELAIKSDDLLAGVAGADGINAGEDAVKTVLHVGDQVLGAFGP